MDPDQVPGVGSADALNRDELDALARALVIEIPRPAAWEVLSLTPARGTRYADGLGLGPTVRLPDLFLMATLGIDEIAAPSIWLQVRDEVSGWLAQPNDRPSAVLSAAADRAALIVDWVPAPGSGGVSVVIFDLIAQLRRLLAKLQQRRLI